MTEVSLQLNLDPGDRHRRSRQVKSGPQTSVSPLIQHRIWGGSEQIGVWHKAVDAFAERNRAATGYAALRLAFGAFVKLHSRPRYLSASGSIKKTVDLVIGSARPFAALIASAQRRILGAPQRVQFELRRNPSGRIDILAFMPDFDAGAASRPSQRIDTRQRLDFTVENQFILHCRQPQEVEQPEIAREHVGTQRCKRGKPT